MKKLFLQTTMKENRRRAIQAHNYLREWLAVVMAGLTTYLFYALIIYDSYHGTLMHVSTSSGTLTTRTEVGIVGFFIASVFFYLFGFFAYAVPLGFFFMLHQWLCNVPVARFMRLVGVGSTLLLAMMGLLSLDSADYGALGRFVVALVYPWLGLAGTLIFFSVIAWGALLCLFGISLGIKIFLGVLALMQVCLAVLYALMGVVNSCAERIYQFFAFFVALFYFIYNGVIVSATSLFLMGASVWQRAVSCGRWAYYLVSKMSTGNALLIAEGLKMITVRAQDYAYGYARVGQRTSELSWRVLEHEPNHLIAEQSFGGDHTEKALYYQDHSSESSGDISSYYPSEVTSDEPMIDPTQDLLEDLEHGANGVQEIQAAPEKSEEPIAQEPEQAGKRSEQLKTYFSLFRPAEHEHDADRFALLCQERAHKLEEKLALFGVQGKVVAICPGPVITLFEYRPESTSKISKIIALEDDLALALTAHSIRIIAPIPGRDVVGFEIANYERRMVHFSEILLSDAYDAHKAHLPLILGVSVTGNPVIVDLVEMPHLLIGGTTGSGKSVGMNTMLTSLLCSKNSQELRLILIDPKRLEFSPYADIAHLHFPIVTDANRAARVLVWLVQEMERRYELLATVGVRNIVDYQALAKKDSQYEPMPFIVLMIDELADLMMIAAKEVEFSITRLAQMARAAGIHLIVATQRPSVDVVTGIIKVNFPSRISFRVSSKIDSRTILDRSGAEKLLGKGDMLCMYATASTLQRVHGCYISGSDIERYTNALRAQEKSTYLNLDEALTKTERTPEREERDKLYPEIVAFIQTVGELSISSLQRQYNIGFNRSAQIIEHLEDDGLIAPAQGNKPRKVIR